MRTLRMFCSIAGGALVLMALVGVPAASATRLCGTATSPCPSPLPSGTTIGTSLKSGTTAVLTTSGGLSNPTITCTASITQMFVGGSGGGAGVSVSGNLTGLTFTGCTSVNPTGCSASATVTGVPTFWHTSWTSGSAGSVGVTTPTVSFTCTILGIPVSCSFGAGGTISGTLFGGNPALVTFANQAIAASGGFGCPSTAILNATYTVGYPKPLYVSNS